jgi:DNA-binding transcriptional MocR family regulator
MTNWLPNLSERRGPTYLAIATALAEDVDRGLLRPGTRMPTHRDLAYRLGVTVGTVSRAYAEATNRGLVDGEVGRGTFVRQRIRRDMGDVPISAPLPNGVDFGLNYPPMPPEIEQAFAETLRDVADSPDLGRLLRYAPHGGSIRHREAAAMWLSQLGHDAQPERTVVTNGAQHSMLVAFSALTEPGDVVLVDKLTFPGMVSLALLLRLRLHGVEVDEDGVVPDSFARACATYGPKAYYCMPTLHNPTTAILSPDRRRAIADLAERYNVLIVEDDIYRFLVPDAAPPLASLVPDRTLFLSSAAKQLAPGLRIGALSAPPRLLQRVEVAVRTTTWMAAPPMAEVFARWIEDGTAERLAKAKRCELAVRQRLAGDALRGLQVKTHPTSMHLWLTVPDVWRDADIAGEAARRGISVSPGALFAVSQGAGRGHLRLSIGNPPAQEDVVRGATQLAEMLQEPPEELRSIV